MSIYLRNFIRFLFLVLVQVLLLNKIPLNWWAPSYISFIYPLFIILLPIFVSPSMLCFLGFIIGITIDAFMNTGGINAFATVLIAYLRNPILEIMLPQSINFYKNYAPGPKIMNWKPFLIYAGILMLIHNSVFTFLEIWSLKSMGYFIIKTGVTFLTSMLFVILYLLLFTKSVNKRIKMFD